MLQRAGRNNGPPCLRPRGPLIGSMAELIILSC